MLGAESLFPTVLTVGISLAGAAAVFVAVFLSRRATATMDLQDKTITALQAELTIKDREIQAMRESAEGLRTEIAKLRAEVAHLRELVTQAAKVDQLRSEFAEGHGEVMTALAKIGAERRTPPKGET